MTSPRTRGAWIGVALICLTIALPLQADTHSDIVALFQATNTAAFNNNLNFGERTSLVTKLIGALAAVDRGNDTAARGAIDAFVNEVEALERSGRLPSGDAAALAGAAREILEQLPPRGNGGLL